jgi:hypothetical protein
MASNLPFKQVTKILRPITAQRARPDMLEMPDPRLNAGTESAEFDPHAPCLQLQRNVALHAGMPLLLDVESHHR